MTTVINLFGSPNSGKSTTAAGLYYFLKMRGFHCEMVREYYKNWVWEGRTANKFDQPYIFGKQLKYESLLYEKVDYVITDSPLILPAYYEKLHEETNIVLPAAMRFMEHAKSQGIMYKNFWLDTVDNIDNRGRQHDEEAIAKIANDMYTWLTKELNFDIQKVKSPLDKRVDFIIDIIS